MPFARLETLLQKVTIDPIGAALPIVQGTSFAFPPIVISLVAGKGVDAPGALFAGVIASGIFHGYASPCRG